MTKLSALSYTISQLASKGFVSRVVLEVLDGKGRTGLLQPCQNKQAVVFLVVRSVAFQLKACRDGRETLLDLHFALCPWISREVLSKSPTKFLQGS